MGSFSIWHWLIVLAIVLLVFGTNKLRTVGTDLGGAVKGFRDGVRAGEAGGGHWALVAAVEAFHAAVIQVDVRDPHACWKRTCVHRVTMIMGADFHATG